MAVSRYYQDRSGTTVMVAKQTGRRWIGIETSECFCNMTKSKLKQGILQFKEVIYRSGLKGGFVSIKEKMINKAINKINIRLTKINLILNANPLADICILRIEAQKIINKNISNAEKTRFIKSMSAKEKELFSLAKKHQKSIELLEEKIKLQNELMDLNNELFWNK